MSSGWTTLLLLTTSLASAWMYATSLQAMQDTDGQPPQASLTIQSPAWEQFDKQGKPANSIQAARLEQWPGEGSARLYRPVINAGDDRRIRWRAESRQGRIFAGSQTLLLQRQVVLDRQLPDRKVRIETEQLMIDQVHNSVTTREPVNIHSGSWTTSAAGLRADMNDRKLELLGQVKSHHE